MTKITTHDDKVASSFNLMGWLAGSFAVGFMLFPIVLLSFRVPFIGANIAIACASAPIVFLVLFVIQASSVPKGSTRPPVALIIVLIPILIVLQILGFIAFASVMALTGYSEWLDIGAHLA